MRQEEAKNEIIAQLIDFVEKKHNLTLQPELIKFIPLFYRHVPAEDLIHTDIDQLYGSMMSVWHLAQTREVGKAIIRVHSPNVETDGWQSKHSMIDIINDDMPFLVDSISAELNRLGITIHLIIHPIIHVLRDEAGHLVQIEPAEKGVAESFMQIQIDAQNDQLMKDLVVHSLHGVLEKVRCAVEDWQKMRSSAEDVMNKIHNNTDERFKHDKPESLAFVKWVYEDHFTFLGSREYIFKDIRKNHQTEIRNGLGILRDPDFFVFDGLRNFDKLPTNIQEYVTGNHLLMVTKTSHQSVIHRPVPMDAILVKMFDDKGAVIGEQLFIGLFTSVAYNKNAREIPFLRQKVLAVLEKSNISPKSHDGKALTHILDTFPRDELFQISTEELYEISMGILNLQERHKTKLFLRHDPFNRFVSCFVYVPRDQYDVGFKENSQRILEHAFHGQTQNCVVHISDSVHARLHFVIKLDPENPADFDLLETEAELVQAARSWHDLLKESLIESYGEEKALQLLKRYQPEAFSRGYQEHYNIKIAALDVKRIEEVMSSKTLGVNIFRMPDASENELSLKIYQYGVPIILSDVLPVIENMGLKVITELPFEVTLADHDQTVWIHDFKVSLNHHTLIDINQIRPVFTEHFIKVWTHDCENDGLNKLTIAASLSWREVMILRTYAKYLRQARIQFSYHTLVETLAAYPEVSKLLVQFFMVVHSIDNSKEAVLQESAILKKIGEALNNVENLDEDQILRRFLNVIGATLRTNYFQVAENGAPKTYLSVKIDSKEVDALPLPRPMVEIFVFSSKFEAVHLRGGKVARGGIRWSDRLEDFRTEILGLMKAQMVKNTVIVPVGSKGGFVVKHPPAPELGREALMKEVIDCYKTFMRGLLDLTDNLVAGKIVKPERIICLDADDPYLVVAADKGTATFSDIANSVSLEYGFWLGDAFASGGSAGYDHKKMGITARGAWESVKRHFFEMGRNIQKEEFSCIGVGDMSGDVFGNGMLLSPYTKLIGAFNHLHIFCDPNPDLEKSFEERKRMFDLPRSSWNDYNPDLISQGGGVFDRKLKSIPISAQMKQAYNIHEDQLTPAELMRAMLKTPIDLLWFGGIGTFVKASTESHLDVGDKANDALRINADDLQAKVIGEGANLGMTQKARISYALKGGRINTDAIDNSAGVDTSDHEVNIKILLNDLVTRSDMTIKQRDQILVTMTDEVARLVLADNYLQTQALSIIQSAGLSALESHVHFMTHLEKEGQLNCEVEQLPTPEELGRRALMGQGLTRPELAVLLAYAKITLYNELLHSNLTKDPFMVQDLLRYFPKTLRKDYREAIERHHLRNEIITTVATNNLINRVGPTFVHEMVDNTGLSASDIVKAYIIIRESFGLRYLFNEIAALQTDISSQTQMGLVMSVNNFIQKGIIWFVSHPHHLEDIQAQIDLIKPGALFLGERMNEIIPGNMREAWEAEKERAIQNNVPEKIAHQIASFKVLQFIYPIILIGQEVKQPLELIAQIFFEIGEQLGIAWLRDTSQSLVTENRWQKQNISAVQEDLMRSQIAITKRILSHSTGKHKSLAAGEYLQNWVQTHLKQFHQFTDMLTEFHNTPGNVDFAMINVAGHKLTQMVA